ncbi:hypothetical protein TNCV_3678521 [Trichonephila clavipes]|nr:hypothetical protein TNCV_3678521 [Trichonephila clavipes]
MRTVDLWVMNWFSGPRMLFTEVLCCTYCWADGCQQHVCIGYNSGKKSPTHVPYNPMFGKPKRNITIDFRAANRLSFPNITFLDLNFIHFVDLRRMCSSVPVMTATAGSDVVQSGSPIFDDFFQHLWPNIGNNTANVVFQMVKRL